MILTVIERPPKVGDAIKYAGARFEVTSVSGHGVASGIVEVLPEQAEPQTEQPSCPPTPSVRGRGSAASRQSQPAQDAENGTTEQDGNLFDAALVYLTLKVCVMASTLRGKPGKHALAVRFVTVPVLCLVLTAFAAVLRDGLEGQGLAREASPVSLRPSRPAHAKVQPPASPQTHVFALFASGTPLPAPELLARLGQLPACSLPPLAALAMPSCRAPPFA